MTNDLDDLFDAHDRRLTGRERQRRADREAETESAKVWASRREALVPVIDGLATSARARGHDIAAGKLNDKSLGFQIKFKERPSLAYQATFTMETVRPGHAVVQVSLTGPGREVLGGQAESVELSDDRLIHWVRELIRMGSDRIAQA